MLSVAGTETMFAAMGHFSQPSIALAFGCFSYPCLIIAYFGQVRGGKRDRVLFLPTPVSLSCPG